MLNRLSAKYQKEIALSLMAVFMISGLGGLKAQALSAVYRTSGIHSLRTSRFSGSNGATGFRLSNRPPAAAAIPSTKPVNDADIKPSAIQAVLSGSLQEKPGPDKADIGGPSQPEMTAFKSVGSDNMVSPFTGDFSYNIPLLDVGGYPVNMFYSSGISMDQEASWVGLGWNINPGTITRNMRGLPDDFNGSDKITKTLSFRDDKTFGITAGANIKLAGFPIKNTDSTSGLKLGASLGLAWNNKLGVSAEAGINPALSISTKNGSLKTWGLTVGAGLNASSRSGASVSPSISIQKELGKGTYGGSLNGSIGVGYNYSSRIGLTSMHLDMNVSESWRKTYIEDKVVKTKGTGSFDWGGSSGTLSFAYPSVVPSITKPLTRENYSMELSAGFENMALNPNFKLKGYYSRTYLAEEDKVTYHPAFGMLYLQAANDNKDALLDFNRANDGVYTPNNPVIAMPVYTYDVFSINGEGIGGSFRAYRGDAGHMRDATVKTKEQAFGAGLNLGFGNMVHVGADINYVYSPSQSGNWELNNMADTVFKFRESEKEYQAVYFKNPGEKTVPDAGFQAGMGGDDLVRLKLSNTASANPMLLPKLIRYDGNKNIIGEKIITASETKKLNRDKRTQVISFLNAAEAERIGMSSKLYSYTGTGTYENKIIYGSSCNKTGVDSFYRNQDVNHAPVSPEILGGETETFRHQHHISQIDVLGGDGRRYVYGLPVYNKKQYNVTFSIDASQKTGETRAVYDGEDNTKGNHKGRDRIMEKEEIPAYTHSYLLTELISSNYVDVTGNGISEDDMGDAVKFNYSKYNDYKWRTPVGSNTASYSSGLKTDDKDDKAHYVYGEREQWYLYSVESKNMVARFYVKSDRRDGHPVVDENGALDMDASRGMKRLEKISLFSKGELTKKGDNAKPIKTIRFFQSYKLCKNNTAGNELGSNAEAGQGKLTLDSIWVSYNGNTRKPKSRYVFYYPGDNNPDYKFEQSDRWGNYKARTDNPDPLLTNEEYPYSTQDRVKADRNAAAWAMNKILLPSGALLTVEYESDSYAYVQNKKAASMCAVVGFGTSTTSLPAVAELSKLYMNGGTENDKVYIQLPYAITATGSAGRTEFASRYLEETRQLYLKLAVTMPTGAGLSGIAGEEMISVYADIADYGLINSTTAWIRVAETGNGHTPMVQAALQFLTRQLPGKAYKGYDLSEEGGLKAIVMALGGMLNSVGSMIRGEDNVLKGDLKCQQAVLYKSFARLTNPVRNKLGGGYRVKRVVINDNWDKMTGQSKATYGQEYRYTTTETINGRPETISSGVASWEPSIGSEENPHREIMRYVDHNKGGPYDYGAAELPLGEMFYPSPMVGYSRVEVLSIHRDTVKNQPTRQVLEFYTNKEFPYKSVITDLKGDANARYEPAKIMQLLRIDMMKGIAQSQGFLVETNDMHGKEKSNAVYSANDPENPVSFSQYFYNTKQVTDKNYVFNHDFPVIARADGKVSTALIGKDVEVMTDFREHRSETITANLSINFDGFILGFFPVPLTNLLQPVVREGTAYRSAAILKLVTHYGMMDSVVVIDKGSMVSTKNLVYDAETGNPLLTRTQNEHNKPVYSFSYPAHWAYSGMGMAYKNIDAAYSGLEFRHGILTNPPAGLFDILESGDELYVVKMGDDSLTRELPCDDPALSYDAWTTLRKNEANRIWAVNTQKAGAANPEWVFMDAKGEPYNASFNTVTRQGANIRIVRSGKRNMISQAVASVTSLNNPIVNGQLVFNEATNIIQTTAATFKDHWRVDNSFIRVTETVDSSVYARVKRVEISPEQSVTVSYDRHYRSGGNEEPGYPRKYIEQGTNSLPLYKYVKYYSRGGGRTYQKDFKKSSFLLYSKAEIPGGANFYKGMLSLFSHSNTPLFPVQSGYMKAEHPLEINTDFDEYTIHGTGNAQYPATVANQWPTPLGYVTGLMQNWFGTAPNPTNANNWVNTYLAGSGQNVSVGKGVIPYPVSAWESYLFAPVDKRVNVSLPIMTAQGSQLSQQNKIGFRLNLENDDFHAGDLPKNSQRRFSRCFWSQNAFVPKYGNFGTPWLYYYYYQWGNTSMQYTGDNDPSVNVMITKHIARVTATYCKSKFDGKAMNPYVEGVLGNWRVDSTYTYYGERKEGDLTMTQMDTRIAGAIKNYQGFWNFASTPPANSTAPIYLSRNQQASDVWVWNSAVTQYNRKGYEIENTDPLGRYNAGLYGYNQQMPVAIANNARVREVLFDGYEDYDYQTSVNCISCVPHRSFNYDTAIASQIDATQYHTGRYSLRVNPGRAIAIQAPVITPGEADIAFGLKLQNKTTNYTNQSLGTNGIPGTGLKATWYNHAVSGNYNSPLEPASSVTYPQAVQVYTQEVASPEVGASQQLGANGITDNYFSVKWEGKIQAPSTGLYYFKPAMLDDGYRLRINGITISKPQQWTNGYNNQQLVSDGFNMVVGQVYTIEIAYYNWTGVHQFQLQWKKPGTTSFEKVPLVHLYSPASAAYQQVITTQQTCYRLDSSQVTGHALTDSFSLIQQKKMLVSGWVKVGTANCCYPATYDNGSASVTVSYDENSWASDVIKPSGPVIEGWQRFEGVFEVPVSVTKISLSLNNSGSGAPVFYDDIRVQPYNSNMKTYVYHSGNLRLMAELDENNYGSFYEYDDDGTLTRMKKETERGVKTITETRSAMQKKVNGE